MYDQPILIADSAHLAIHMMVVRMRAGYPVESTAELVARREHLVESLNRWCKEHRITLEWSASPGRRTGKREYRIAYHGDNLDAAEPNALYNELDAAMLRIMLEEPSSI